MTVAWPRNSHKVECASQQSKVIGIVFCVPKQHPSLAPHLVKHVQSASRSSQAWAPGQGEDRAEPPPGLYRVSCLLPVVHIELDILSAVGKEKPVSFMWH